MTGYFRRARSWRFRRRCFGKAGPHRGRARALLLGHFSLPGGVVEVGETLADAVARELMEEVGVEAEIIAFNRHVEAIFHEGSRIRTHFVIASFVARWVRGEPRLSDEVDAVDWTDPADGLPSPTTPQLGEILCERADRSSARLSRKGFVVYPLAMAAREVDALCVGANIIVPCSLR